VKCEGSGSAVDKIVVEPYPKRATEIIVAGGKATLEYGDPLVAVTQPDGSQFSPGASAAFLASITPFTTSEAGGAYCGLSEGPAAFLGFNFIRFGDGSAQTRYRDPVQYTSNFNTLVSGTEFSLMMFNRSATYGAHILLHDSGNKWKRVFVNDDQPTNTMDTPIVYSVDFPLTVSRIALALLDLSSIADADFAEVTDSGTNVAQGTTFSCEADSHINKTWTYEAGKITRVSWRNQDATHHWQLSADSTNLSLQVHDGAGYDTLGSSVGVLADATAYELDIVTEGSTCKVYLDKVLKITGTSAKFNAATGASMLFNNLASNDVNLTFYPYPALGGDVFGATDRVVCPQDSDTADCLTDHYMVMRDVIVPSSAGTHFHRGTVYDASPWCLGTVIGSAGEFQLKEYRSGGADIRINGGAASITDNDDGQIAVDGQDSEIFVNGVSIGGTYASTLYEGNTGFKVFSMGTGGVMDAIEIWPRYINTPFRI
jgi:hypothetical protein